MTTKKNTIITGLDIGNGYVKGVARQGLKGTADAIDIPSGVALMTRPNHMPIPDDSAVPVVLGEGDNPAFFDALDASFTSPLINDHYRRLFGARGIAAGGSFEEFDVVGHRSKAEQPLSKILALGLVAAKALIDHVRQKGALPTSTLEVEARAALALPVGEYIHHRVAYATGFTQGAHTVVIHNFETPVTVRIVFSDVQVIAEGASAQYAIADKGARLAEGMLADVRARGMALDPAITGDDIVAARNTVGLDIGEGTSGLIVFTDGKFNADASRMFAKGYGNVLTSALVAMEESTEFRGGFTSRKQLASFLQEQPGVLRKARYERTKAFVDEEILFFASEVAEQVGRVLADVGATTEVMYVYGGGAGAVKEALYPLLMAKVSEMIGIDDAFPVLYLDERYSRFLNREGLLLAADIMAKKAGVR